MEGNPAVTEEELDEMSKAGCGNCSKGDAFRCSSYVVWRAVPVFSFCESSTLCKMVHLLVVFVCVRAFVRA